MSGCCSKSVIRSVHHDNVRSNRFGGAIGLMFDLEFDDCNLCEDGFDTMKENACAEFHVVPWHIESRTQTRHREDCIGLFFEVQTFAVARRNATLFVAPSLAINCRIIV